MRRQEVRETENSLKVSDFNHEGTFLFCFALFCFVVLAILGFEPSVVL
jgi:hypothetical protein